MQVLIRSKRPQSVIKPSSVGDRAPLILGLSLETIRIWLLDCGSIETCVHFPLKKRHASSVRASAVMSWYTQRPIRRIRA